ncbi:MAG: alpha/beta fold hydrolase [Candidatus Hydrogenedentes bacterium]|nr:alpha/beta fold hydrolase [Candidatus Hydrogenedentota bacterium]
MSGFRARKFDYDCEGVYDYEMRQPAFSTILTLSRACALTALSVACGCSAKNDAPAASASREVKFATSDGYTIAATMYPADQTKPPGLVLVPMLGSTRERWQNFARAAQREGYMAIAIDMRGHGDSTVRNGENTSHKSFKTEDWLGVLHDIEAAKKSLIENGADTENIAVIGASIGANLALRYATTDPDIQAVGMISPGMDYRGVTVEEPFKQLKTRPVLLMDAIGDAYSADTCTALEKLAPGHCDLHEYAGAAHGTDLLDTNENAIGQILQWLSPIIGPDSKKVKM